MKKFTISLFVVMLSLCATAQDASVEQSVFGIQTGFLGVWAHNESKLSNSIALRSEIGLDAGISISSGYGNDVFFLAPVITLEPRWYYNLNRRVGKSKRIDGNSGNFIAIKTSYHPDLFLIGAPENLVLITDLSIIPTYGIRRHIGKHFTYEAGFGIGYIKYFEKENVYFESQPEVMVNLHLRLGYTL